jgi:hypothetical protein
MDTLLAALTSGLAVAQTARGAQRTLSTAGQRPPVFAIAVHCHKTALVQAICAPRVEGRLFDPPNAIKVGASSDLERIVSLNPCARPLRVSR